MIRGTGEIARKRHIPAILKAPDGNLYGFYNRNTERTKELAKQYQVHAFESLEEIWGNEDVHAVLISTPPGSHAELAIQALHAGSHDVVVEKRNGEKCYYDFSSAHPQGVWELTDAHQRFFESILNDTEPPGNFGGRSYFRQDRSSAETG